MLRCYILDAMKKTNLKFKNKPLSVKKHNVFFIATDRGFSIFGGCYENLQGWVV